MTEVNVKAREWFTAKTILELQGIDIEWLWDKYIPAGSICGITGPSDTGKSTLLRQLALSIVNGEASLLGNKLNLKHKKVIYVSTEDSVIGLKGNLSKQVATFNFHQGALESLAFLFSDGKVLEKIDNVLRRFPVDLVIFDSMGDTFDGNANDFVSVRQYMRQLKFIVRKYGCSILLLHHNVKNSEKGIPNKNNLNGSQGFEAKMRSLIELRLGESKDERLLTILKGNYVSQIDKGKSRVLKFDEERMIYEHTDKEFELGNRNAVKYNKQLWIDRYTEIPPEWSIAQKLKFLQEKYIGENVPGKTWFLDNLKNENK